MGPNEMGLAVCSHAALRTAHMYSLPTRNKVYIFAVNIVIQSKFCVSDCGDGILNPGEECDDGNTVEGDGCSAVCTFTIDIRASKSTIQIFFLFRKNFSNSKFSKNGFLDSVLRNERTNKYYT